MNRLHTTRRLALCLLVLTVGCGGSADDQGTPDSATEGEAPTSEADLEQQARQIHDDVISIDTHDDIPFNFATPEVDPLNADRKVNLEKMRAGGLDVGFFVVYVGQTERTPGNYESALTAATISILLYIPSESS